MTKMPSEPFRTAAGASQLKGDAALPFKDMIRAFDCTTQSIVHAMVMFNRKFNPKLTPEGDYNVIARGATSLMAKEVRGMQADNLAQTLTPDEKMYVDARKLLKVRVAVRDMEDIMVDDAEAARREAQQAATSAQQQDQQNRMFEANLREALANAFKSITQGQKNTATADAESVNAAEQLLEKGMNSGLIEAGGSGPDQNAQPGVQGGGADGADPTQAPGASQTDPNGATGGGDAAAVPPATGGM
jgi:ribosomal protein S20